MKPILIAARTWLDRSLHRRFIATSLALLLVIQLASLGVIQVTLDRHGSRVLGEQLANAARTLQHMVTWEAQRLDEQSRRLLATDEALRVAVQSGDRASIATVLGRQVARLGASDVVLLSKDFTPLAYTDGSTRDPEPAVVAATRLARQAMASSVASEIAVVRGQPRQLVVVPLPGGMPAGWMVLYFMLPNDLAEHVHDLSAADLTLITREAPGSPWRVVSSRLGAASATELAGRVGPTAANLDVVLRGQPLAVRAVQLSRAGGLGEAEAVALVSAAADRAPPAPEDLRLALLVTTLIGILGFGLVSTYAAQRITIPLRSLAAAAERLGSGDTTAPFRQVGGHGEVRELAHAFEQMRLSLAVKQEQIAQQEKLASIGQLAAGVAHEINNPIGFVFSNFGMLDDYVKRLFRMLAAYRAAESELAGSPTAERLERLRDEIELDYLTEDTPALMDESRDGIRRVRKIVQDLKDFSHVDSRQEWETVDLHAGLDSTLNIVNNEIKYKADVVKAYGTLPPVDCLPHELNQVFMNLLVNAAHAIGPDRGTITLRTGHEGDDAWVEVADNGVGIPRDHLKRIFDPFFTTKPVGKGTGLGLSLSYGIVKKHGGRIDVTSEPGRGSAFRVWVPARRRGA